MDQTHICDFRTQRGRECRHHLRSEFPIRFSPKLGMYLCAQHEQFIIKDHMTQFYDAQIRHKDIPTGIVGVTYNTFSTQVWNRFIDTRNIQHLPIVLPINKCLYTYDIIYAQLNNAFINCNIFIKNEANYIQIGFHHDAEIRSFFSYPRLLFHQSDNELQDELDRFYDNLNMNVEVYNINMPPEIHQRAMDELRTQFEVERNALDTNDDEDIIDIILEPVHAISSVPSPLPVYEDNDEPFISNQTTNTSNGLVIEPEIVPVKNKLEITMIELCDICISEEEQKGFRMSCCNKDNKVCVDCVINQQLIQYTKYCDYMDIKNMKMFKEESQCCFFCRNFNSVEAILDDIDCKQKFIDILQVNIQKELKKKEQNRIALVRSQIGLQ